MNLLSDSCESDNAENRNNLMFIEIPRISRLVSSHPHLRVLALVEKVGETSPQAVAEELTLHHSVAARHLLDLAACGLLTDRVKGSEHIYRLSKKTATLAADTMAFLKPLLPKLDYTQGIPLDAEIIANAATGFTYERRVRIYAFLQENADQSASELASPLKIPIPSVVRHLVKLTARGYVRGKVDKSIRRYDVAQPKHEIHRAYTLLVCKYLA